MDINATLIIQMLVFAVFVWFTMKFVWPPLAKALEERQDKIADGLSAAERGRKELELAQHRITEELKQAKGQAAEIVEKATRRGAQIVEEAKEDAKKETKRLLQAAEDQIQQDIHNARDSLRKELSALAIAGAEAILKREVDEKANSKLIADLIEEI